MKEINGSRRKPDPELKTLKHEQKHLRDTVKEYDKKFRRLIEHHPDPIAVHRDGVLVYVNRALIRLAGFRKKTELLGKPFLSFLHPDHRKIVQERIAPTLTGRYSEPRQEKLVTADGKIHTVQIRSLPTVHQGESATQIMIKNLTGLKEQETVLQQTTTDLALINNLNQAVNEGRDFKTISRILSEAMRTIFSATGATLWLLDNKGRRLIRQNIAIPGKIGRELEKLVHGRISDLDIAFTEGSRYWGQLETGQSTIYNDGKIIKSIMAEATRNQKLKRLAPLAAGILRYHSLMAVPLTNGDRYFGILDMGRNEPFSERDLKRFEGLATQVTGILLKNQANKALQESELRFRQLVDSLHEGIWVIDEKERTTYVNPRMTEILGYTPEEMTGAAIAEFMTPNERRNLHQYWRKHRGSTKEQHEFTFLNKAGEPAYVLLDTSPLLDGNGKTIGAIVSVTDISKRRMEETKREVLSNIVENISRTTHLGELLQRIYSNINRIIPTQNCYIALYDPVTELVSFPFFVDQHDPPPQPRKKTRGITEYVLRTGRPFLGNKTDIQALHNRKEIDLIGAIPESWLGVPLVIQSQCLGVLAVQSYTPGKEFKTVDRDLLVTIGHQAAFAIDRKASESHLMTSEARLRMLFEQSVDGILVVSENKIESVNHALCKMYGAQPEDLIGKNPVSLIHPEDRPRVQERIRALMVGETVSDISTYRAIMADNSVKWVEIRSNPITWEGKRMFQSIARDITDQRRREEELQRAEKLESLSILAGGIAHDFNNLLTGILGNISLARIKADKNSDFSRILKEAENAAISTKSLTQQLLTFAKGGSPVKELVSISRLIKETAVFALRGSSSRCKFDLQRSLKNIEADEGQITQVINNLIINADMAMPEGGTIQVGAENIQIKSGRKLLLAPGDYIKITIRDHGIGIKKEHLNKIFDPYFTTKQKGSGLGLATAYSIIKKHNGLITVESEIGRGTLFTIFLPAASGPVNKQLKETPRTMEIHARVLIMDDEKIVRTVLSRMLEHFGCTVSEARDGAEALEMYETARTGGTPFDVIIMDLTIPGGMGGKATISRLRELDHEVKTIVSSGYSNDPIIANYQDYGFNGFVTKPYKIEELQAILRKVLRLR